MAGETTLERRPFSAELSAAPQAPRYYDISMLKPPVWGSDIAVYFFLGGLSAGAYLLARSAERFGGERYRRLTQVGTVVAAIAAVPCAPLLIIDLGDPKRFLNMLRVFKPRSPMNLGAWTLTAYTGVSALALLREWLRGDRTPDERSTAANILDGALVTVCDAAGAPLALLLATYTGVLLSATSTPVWSKNPWLGAMFTASAVNTGSAAISLALDAWDAATGADRDDAAHEALQRIDTAAHAAEAVTLMGFHAAAGSLAKPLTTGKAALPFWTGAAAMTAAEVLKLLPLRGRAKRCADAAAAVCGLAGGFALRWSLVHAGPMSANDPEAARQASRPRFRG
jgi:formate-dependent nitrite reductase membrane component NrfD